MDKPGWNSPPSRMMDHVTCGDCVQVMKDMPAQSVDFIVTDPPYLVRYRDRAGRKVINDDNDGWLKPAFAQMHRVLKRDALCISFYGWSKADTFLTAWREAGFRPVGHIVFRKPYASKSGFTKYHHESAYLLAKGNPPMPAQPPPDVIEWTYSGNRLHPTQKPVSIFKPLIEALTKPGDTVMDPFCGSGSTLAAARDLGRRFIGIEMDPVHQQTASRRLSANPRDSNGQPLDLPARFNQQSAAAAAVAGSATGTIAPRSTDDYKNNRPPWRPPPTPRAERPAPSGRTAPPMKF
jgi:DNA modification methylase